MRTKLETMEFVGWNAIVCVLILTASHEVVTAQSVVPPPAVSVTPVVSRQVTETGTTSFSTARWRSRVAHMDDADLTGSARLCPGGSAADHSSVVLHGLQSLLALEIPKADRAPEDRPWAA